MKKSKDSNVEPIPSEMCLNESSLPDQFASDFDAKVKAIVDTTTIDNAVYNRRKIVKSYDKMFMDEGAIKECINLFDDVL